MLGYGQSSEELGAVFSLIQWSIPEVLADGREEQCR